MIVYLDEVNFTKLSFKGKEWSAKNTNLTVDQTDIYTGYRSVVATMTEEWGLELNTIYDKAVKAPAFIKFLKDLRKRFDDVPLTLFMDGMKTHKDKDV